MGLQMPYLSYSEDKMNIKNGQRVSLHYTGKLADGTVFDSSRERKSPLHFVFGSGVVLPNFEKAIGSMLVGDKKTFNLTSDEAYGQHIEEAVQALPKEQFGQDLELKPGTPISGTSPDGQPIRAMIISCEDETVTVDFNHPLAGKDISFDVELLSLE